MLVSEGHPQELRQMLFGGVIYWMDLFIVSLFEQLREIDTTDTLGWDPLSPGL